MMWISTLAVLAGTAILFANPATAQSLDCTKARPGIETALCASPALMEADRALAVTYAAALAREPGRTAAIRTEQRAWLAERDRLCLTANASASRVAACLTGLYRARIVALGPSGPGSPPPSPPARAGAVPPGPVQPTAAGQAPSGTTAGPPATILAGPPRPVLPSLPLHLGQPAASLSRPSIPATGTADTLLEVQEPGRFSIRAESATGVALQLVDMITGPGNLSGEAGTKDGRIDALLDRGTYKIRSFGAARAAGEAKLTVAPFSEAEIANALVFGGTSSSELGDLKQLSAWVSVGKDGLVSVEAVGRSLVDVRLWRNGTDVADLSPRVDTVSPKPGHPMTRARLDGTVEPGLYLVTAYGGPKFAWADGDPAQPLHLRVGPPEPVLGGWLDGTIGPSGSARFEAAASATQFRLELPEVAPAMLAVRRGSSVRTASVVKNSREPVAILQSPTAGDAKAVIEVTGPEGQPFRIRALDPSGSRRISGVGPHLVSIAVAGEVGDEFPATVLLAHLEGGKGARVLASSAPQVGPGKAWRQKVNFRGRSSLVFEVTAAGPVAVTLTGPRASATITPALGNRPPRTDGKTPRWDLEPGWYELKLAPVENSSGVMDLTVGPPGVAGEIARPVSARPSIALGTHVLERGGNYQIITNEAPALVLAPSARPLPLNLEADALAIGQDAGQALEIPVRMPPRGYLAVRTVDGVPVPVSRGAETTNAAGRVATLRIPAGERARGIVLSWSDPPRPEATALDPAARGVPVVAGRPTFFDLTEGASRSMVLEVPQGGLYRVETLGRLKTSLAVAAAFEPSLDKAEANGAGQNALTQSYLRAGRYRLAVKALESAGRVGVVALPAALVETPALARETSARATLADGRGAIFPIEIASAGKYRLDLYALGAPLRARLEDAEGWPLTVPGPVTAIERRFEPGRYRLVVLPQTVETRAVARLSTVAPEVTRTGHGPHPLAFEETQSHQWREPAGAAEARTPDRWEFELKGPAEVTLGLSDGMVGDLLRAGETAPVARVVGRTDYKGRLAPGRYALEARSLGRNDRLDYRVSLAAREIQPGAPRNVALPATIPFALAEDGVVSLTTFGRTDLRGILKDGEGRVVERLSGRADDWNLALSRLLPAGAYTLDLTAIGEGPKPSVRSSEDGESAAASDDGETRSAGADGDDAADGEQNTEQASGENGEDGAAQADTVETEAADGGVEVRFALPGAAAHPALDLAGQASVAGPDVHRFDLPSVEAGRLLLVAARAASEVVLSVERRDASGRWSAVAASRGANPLVAIPAGNGGGALRVAAWTVDGAPARLAVAARAVKREPGGTGRLEPEAMPFGEVASDVRVDLVAAPGSGVLAVRGAPEGLLAGSVPGQGLQPVAGGLIVPQSDAVWIVARGGADLHPTVDALPAPTGELALTVPADGRATWPRSAPGTDRTRVFRADSTFGQPGLSAGAGMGVAPGSAIAFASGEALRAWNAGGSDALAVRVAALDLARKPEVRADAEYSAALPAAGSQPVRLPDGRKRLTVDLAAGTAAMAEGPGGARRTIWSGIDAVSRTLDGEWTSVLLVNLGVEAKPVHLSVSPPVADPAALVAGAVLKRFFGAAGSLSLRLSAESGDRVTVAGADATFVGDDGRVLRGRSLSPSGPGELVLDYGPGLVAAWAERAGKSPWPQVEAKAVTLPSTAKLEGPTMALGLKPAAPVLLRARTSAPVILSVAQGSDGGEPLAFAAGAAFSRLLAPSEATLRLYSPHDGPLSGTLELAASPITPAGEGLGEAVALAPGASALFGFEVKRKATIGVGVRAEPDIVGSRLLDTSGRVLGTGVAQLHTLEPGRYVLEASVPADGRTTAARPALIGLDPPPSGPPPDVVATYLQLVGLAPTTPAR